MVPIIEIPPGIPSRGCYRFSAPAPRPPGRKSRRPARRAYDFAHRRLNGLARGAVYRRAADSRPIRPLRVMVPIPSPPRRVISPGRRASRGRKSACRGWRQYHRRRLYEWRRSPACPSTCGDSTLRHGVTPESHNGDLMNEVLAHHHQRRDLCRRRRAGSGGIAFTQRLVPFVPHRGVEGCSLIRPVSGIKWR